MVNSCDLTFQQKSLFQQGYQRFSPQELKQLEWGLRFTPAACSLITAVALYYQLPFVLFAVAALGIWAFFAPAKHPMDLIYNHGVRYLFGAIALPENPFQRRLACFAAGLMNTAAAGLFLAGLPIAAWVVGGMLLFLQAIVIFTHFCTLSWMYEGLMRLMGKWAKPIEVSQAVSLMEKGAMMVDVRSANEFARETVHGSLNLPLEELDQHIETFKNTPCILFCNSGARSHIAQQKLLDAGLSEVYNLGAFDRARTLGESHFGA